MEKNSIVTGTVSGLTNFGAFVKLDNGQVGMIHISEIADEFVSDINEFLRMGDAVKVKILKTNKKGKLELSLKQAGEEKEVIRAENRKQTEVKPENKEKRREETTKESFESKMSAFLKDSEEKLLDLKRNIQGKQGIKRRKK